MLGFRAMARTILDEVLGFRPDFNEHQLAHAVRDPKRSGLQPDDIPTRAPRHDAGLGDFLRPPPGRGDRAWDLTRPRSLPTAQRPSACRFGVGEPASSPRALDADSLDPRHVARAGAAHWAPLLDELAWADDWLTPDVDRAATT